MTYPEVTFFDIDTFKAGKGSRDVRWKYYAKVKRTVLPLAKGQ